MNKSELPIEHIENINFAVSNGLDNINWDLVSVLSGGLTGVPVYKIKVADTFYAIKLENINDKEFDLIRNFKIMEMVSQQGISPFVYFTNAERGIILMEFIEVKPRPEVSKKSMQQYADLLRNLHANKFPNWKSVLEVLLEHYQKLTSEYLKKDIIVKCIAEVKRIEKDLFDEKDIRSCHCDLNPVNVLFDGNKYLLVDWQAASPQSFYFDLAYSATWFYFYNEELCTQFLTTYLDREATKEEKTKYYLMRVFVNIYLGLGFISLPLKNNKQFSALSDEAIDKLPSFLEYLQLIGSRKVNLSDQNIQQQFGFVFLKNAVKMMEIY